MDARIPKDSLARSLEQSFPPALTTLLQEILKSVPDFERIASIIKLDPALTANVLTLMNSPYYGLSKKIVDIKHSTVILGTREILNIILSISLYKAGHPTAKRHGHAVHAWRFTIWSALAAQTLAEHHFPEKTDLAYVSILLKDISLLLPEIIPPSQKNAHLKDPGHCFSEINEHEAISSALLADRDLSRKILDAVAHHHDNPPSRCVVKTRSCAYYAGQRLDERCLVWSDRRSRSIRPKQGKPASSISGGYVRTHLP